MAAVIVKTMFCTESLGIIYIRYTQTIKAITSSKAMKNRKFFIPFKNASTKLKDTINTANIPKIKVSISQSLKIDIYNKSTSQYKIIDLTTFKVAFCFSSWEHFSSFSLNINKDIKEKGIRINTYAKITHNHI